TASIVDSKVNATGKVSVTAVTEAALTSDVRNATTSELTGKTRSRSLSLGAVLAMNKASSKADAFIANAAAVDGTDDITAGRGVLVSARDGFPDPTLSTEDVVPTMLSTGDRVRLADDYALGGVAGLVYRYTGAGETLNLSEVDYSGSADFTAEAPLFSSDEGTRPVLIGTTVLVIMGSNAGGTVGSVYRSLISIGDIDLAAQDYSNIANWEEVLPVLRDVAIGTTVKLDDGYAGGGEPGNLYRATTAQTGVDLNAEDYSTGNWELVVPVWELDANIASTIVIETSAELIATGSTSGTTYGTSGGSTDSTGVAGAVATNDVRGGANAYIDQAKITATAGNIEVRAVERATLFASTESELLATTTFGAAGTKKTKTYGKSSSGSNGDLRSLGVSAIIATNVVLSSATATVTESDLTTSDTATTGGDVKVFAQNSAKLVAQSVNASSSSVEATATSKSRTTSSGSSETFDSFDIGVTLAFNSIGWESVNLLFRFIDGLLGDPLIAGAFGGDVGAGATASIVDSVVDASGEVQVQAIAAAAVSSDISNTTSASTTGKKGSRSTSLGAVLAHNKVSSRAIAFIDDLDGTGLASTITAGRGVLVSATDSAAISSVIILDTDSITTVGKQKKQATSGGSSKTSTQSIGISGAISTNDVRGGASAYIDQSTVVATGGDVAVLANERATITAATESDLLASTTKAGGKAKPYGGKTSKDTTRSIGASGIIANNTVQSAATATITNSNVSTLDTGGVLGNVRVAATNSVRLLSEVINSSETDVEGTVKTKSKNGSTETFQAYDIGVTLAFNSIGWQPQNIFFSALEALLQDPLISNALGLENPANATASIEDSLVDATGQVIVSAVNEVELISDINNSTVSKVTGKKGSRNVSVGAVVAMNKVSSAAEAFIQYADAIDANNDVTAGRGVLVSARDG
ncbi:MAG: hypothetical protein KJO55_01925, partial [Gammaproteobacteria bacterium]|nr:hypothetical protein [Gammaproteobacteria bacterium]